jgi:hypothetical protein
MRAVDEVRAKQRVDLIKIDIQQYELEVLRGAFSSRFTYLLVGVPALVSNIFCTRSICRRGQRRGHTLSNRRKKSLADALDAVVPA